MTRFALIGTLAAALVATAHAQSPLTPVTLPATAPADLVGGLPATGRAILVDGQSWFLRLDVPRTLANRLPGPLIRGQHVARAQGTCSGLTSNQICATINVVDPTANIGDTWPGVGLVSSVKLTRHRTFGDTSTTVTTDAGGTVLVPMQRNSTYDLVLVKVPTGYVMPATLAWKNQAVTTSDVWTQLELTKPNTVAK